MATEKKSRPLYEIAAEIDGKWSKIGKGVNFAARPYLSAMFRLDSIHDNFGLDSAQEIVRRFLANASTFRGPDAQRLKAELKDML